MLHSRGRPKGHSENQENSINGTSLLATASLVVYISLGFWGVWLISLVLGWESAHSQDVQKRQSTATCTTFPTFIWTHALLHQTVNASGRHVAMKYLAGTSVRIYFNPHGRPDIDVGWIDANVPRTGCRCQIVPDYSLPLHGMCMENLTWKESE